MKPAHCTHPKEHVHGAGDFVAAVERACAARGLRLTPIRAHVLGLIAEVAQPIKAYDLLERVREGDGPGAAAPPTVYRALEFLLAQGLVHRVERLAAFVSCFGHGAGAHRAQFLICGGCGQVTEIGERAVEAALAEAAGKSGFAIRGATIEAEGLCASCQGA